MCLKLRYRSNIPIWDISERLIKRFIKINKVSALSQDDPSEDHPVIISFDNDRELVHEGAAISHIDRGVSIRRSFWRECNGLAGRTARENRTAAIHMYIYIYICTYTHTYARHFHSDNLLSFLRYVAVPSSERRVIVSTDLCFRNIDLIWVIHFCCDTPNCVYFECKTRREFGLGTFEVLRGYVTLWICADEMKINCLMRF